MPERWVVEIPLTAAWKNAPVLGCYPVACHSLEDNLRARSCAGAINLIVEDFGLEPECSGRDGSRRPKARGLPR